MKKFLVFIYVALVSLFCTSCVIEVQYDSVPFEVNNVYYSLLNNTKTVKNVYYSQSSFNQDFKAAISGAESMQKVVDFKEKFVVTITDAPGNVMKTIEITEVLKKDMGLHIKYRIVEGEKINYTIHPCTVASISREYADYDIAFHDISDWE